MPRPPADAIPRPGELTPLEGESVEHATAALADRRLSGETYDAVAHTGRRTRSTIIAWNMLAVTCRAWEPVS